jgi:3-phenylpropionate/trans-cinnamate dioxygenase ferredoxin subunit
MTGSWVEACAADDIEPEDVIRFDHDGRTFAIYRSPDDRYYATDGLCSHERGAPRVRAGHRQHHRMPQAQWSLRLSDREAKRAPACVDLRTYPVKVEVGKVLIDLGG